MDRRQFLQHAFVGSAVAASTVASRRIATAQPQPTDQVRIDADFPGGETFSPPVFAA